MCGFCDGIDKISRLYVKGIKCKNMKMIRVKIVPFYKFWQILQNTPWWPTSLSQLSYQEWFMSSLRLALVLGLARPPGCVLVFMVAICIRKIHESNVFKVVIVFFFVCFFFLKHLLTKCWNLISKSVFNLFILFLLLMYKKTPS